MRISRTILLLIIVLGISAGIGAQTMEFTYQGTLDAAGNPANGNHDFDFLLFDALQGGSQVGTTNSVSSVSVVDGVFSVTLDFGNQFNGDDRFLEIHVRPSGQGSFTTLSPRQQIKSVPYAIKSRLAADSEKLGGSDANQFVLTFDVRLSNERDPLPFSPNYIQNRSSVQTSANFNISGNGFAGGRLTGDSIDAQTEYFLGGNRMLASPGNSNLYLGLDSGLATSSGGSNSFFGTLAGRFTTNGSRNSFFGNETGFNNLSGSDNSFFGRWAGQSNAHGSRNSFFGSSAGQDTISGTDNSFFGYQSGLRNTAGVNNAFFGSNAGTFNLNANDNSFFGASAGNANSSGTGNSFFGRNSGLKNVDGSFNSFFGAGSGGENLTGNTNSFFGGFSGQSNTSGSSNSFFGYDSGKMNTTGNSNSFFGNSAGFGNISGSHNAFFGIDAGRSNTTGSDNSFFGSAAGSANTGGFNNVFFGKDAGRLNIGGSDNSFFGKDAGRNNSHGSVNVFVGSGAGYNVTTGGANTFVGSNAGDANTTGTSNSFVGRDAGDSNTTGISNSALGRGSDLGSGDLSFATAIGSNAVVTTSNTVQLGRNGLDIVRIGTLGNTGAASLCINGGNEIASCSSSIRYKSNIQPFISGLDLVKRLRPVSFKWKDGGMLDLGLVAEEVAEIEPLLTTTNKDGEIEGVKYDRVGVVLVTAVVELDTEVERQKAKVKRQKEEIDALNKRLEILEAIVCGLKPEAEGCKKIDD